MKTAQALSTMASESLVDATKRKTDGVKGMPLLLKSACSHNAFVNFLGNERARLVDADLERALQTGLVLLGETRAREVYRAAEHACRAVLVDLTNDVSAAGERSLTIPPEPLSSSTTSADRHALSPVERRLTGHWTNAQPLTSGTTKGRFELHMVLLADRRLARTSKSVVFASLRDSSGNWIGSLDSLTELSRAERGRWKADRTVLTLEMEDGSAYEYEYSHQGSSMVTTNTNGGATRSWTRSSL
jgi:hypothetical protein